MDNKACVKNIQQSSQLSIASMTSKSVKMRSRRPPRPQRFFSGENAGLLPRPDGTFPDPRDWEGPDVSLPPILSKARPKASDRLQLSPTHDVSPRKPGRTQERLEKDPFRHRGKLSTKSSKERMRNFENKVISFKTSQEFLCGDLSCSSDFQPVGNTSGSVSPRGVFDRREQSCSTTNNATSPPHSRRTSSSHRRNSDPIHDDFEAISFSGLRSAKKNDMIRVSTSPCKSNFTARTVSTGQSTRSWASSDLEMDLEDDDSLSCDKNTSQQLALQEDELIALAMERSIADVSFDIEESSSISSFDHPSISSSADASVQRLKHRRQPNGQRKYGVRPTRSQLGDAGCHLSMIANTLQSGKKATSRSNIPPMLGVKRATSSEDLDLLDSVQAKPNSREDFVWERDTVTKRWYKRPVSEPKGKSEDDCILERVAELSIRDALKTSLGELQAVAQVRNTRHW